MTLADINQVYEYIDEARKIFKYDIFIGILKTDDIVEIAKTLQKEKHYQEDVIRIMI